MSGFLILLLLLAVAAARVAYLYGVGEGRRQAGYQRALHQADAPPRLNGNVHDCGGLWGTWEQSSQTAVDARGVPHEIPVQMRTCESCGYRQSERVVVRDPGER